MSLFCIALSIKNVFLTLGGELETAREDGAGPRAGTGILSTLQALLSSSGLKPSPECGLFLEEDMISETERIL